MSAFAFENHPMNMDFKERLKDARNRLKQIEEKKDIIDKRQVGVYELQTCETYSYFEFLFLYPHLRTR